jgi:peptidyl-tRNA hydrolase, PTH2 family
VVLGVGEQRFSFRFRRSHLCVSNLFRNVAIMFRWLGGSSHIRLRSRSIRNERVSNPVEHVDPATVKQVIVIRRDLKMRRGKEIAQGSHASGAWLAHEIGATLDVATGAASVVLDPTALAWITGSFRKITLQVQSEDELVALHEAALAQGLRSHLIHDSGRTEFGGVVTITALGIGPDLADAIDEVTGDLAIY